MAKKVKGENPKTIIDLVKTILMSRPNLHTNLDDFEKLQGDYGQTFGRRQLRSAACNAIRFSGFYRVADGVYVYSDYKVSEEGVRGSVPIVDSEFTIVDKEGDLLILSDDRDVWVARKVKDLEDLEEEDDN